MFPSFGNYVQWNATDYCPMDSELFFIYVAQQVKNPPAMLETPL